MGILDPITSCIQRRAKSKSISATSSAEPRSRSRCRCRQRLTAWSMDLTAEKKAADNDKDGEGQNGPSPHEDEKDKPRKLVKRSPSQATASIRIVESEGDDLPCSSTEKDNDGDDKSGDSDTKTMMTTTTTTENSSTTEDRNPPRSKIEDIPEESEPTTPEKTPPPPPATTPATPHSKNALQNKPLPLPPVSTPSPRPRPRPSSKSSRYTPDPLSSDPITTDEEWSPKRASSLFRLSSRRSLIEIVTLLQTTAQAAAAAAATAPRRLHPGLGRGGSPGVPAKSPLRRGVTIPSASSAGSSSEGTMMGSDSETEVSFASSSSSIMLPAWTSSKGGFVRGSTAATAPVSATDTIGSSSSGEVPEELRDGEKKGESRKEKKHRRRAAEVFDQPKPLRWHSRRAESESRLEENEGTEKTLFR
ncbi:uncharacterized protein BDW47DRAFT_127805 [Aspergillus candidus]|uniref:Uncharacterized protein n=1 Tax=Aspergillus candidus TaxID=41067 RepID=A0A2I2F568_ASPCN|nr:hypothetical protein BDW47DRAFT_127805 [Aspergillus candidus]PLB35754.1 hypothetical protein BDW47DRAFT_127805 [Aspergillus candidus]